MLSSPAEEIKSRLNIVEVIQGYIRLHKAGANYRAVCPFHSEKKPSFFVSPARQIWHCFGCAKGGDIFAFVKEIEGVEFGDALRILAQKAGVELKKQDPKLKTERQRLYEICELASKFFEKQLEASKIGQEAKKYILERGINEESIKEWRLGYAPESPNGLSDFLVGRGYKREETERAGLAIKRDGNFFDRFRSRIIFPIFDLNSQIIGFGGRVFQDTENKTKDPSQVVAKYVNSPSTILYDKSQVLYGLDRARVATRKKDVCVLVEGYIDAILSHQAGQENTVATSGTALTSNQLRILRRYSENLLTAFDMDIAGDTATKRGIDLAQSQGFNIKVIIMPEGEDPADVVSKDSSRWEIIIGEAKSIIDFYFETAFSRLSEPGKDLTPEAKKKISKIILPVLKRIPNKIEQSHWVQKLARGLGVAEGDITEELKKIGLQKSTDFPEKEEPLPAVQEKKSRREMIEERITALLIKSPEKINLIEADIISCFSPKIKEIILCIKENTAESIGEKITPELLDFFNYLSLRAEVEETEDIEEEVKTCLREIGCLDKKGKLNLLSREIKKAEETSDSQKVSALIEEFNKLCQELPGS